MSRKLQIKRGLKKNLPNMAQGEFAFTTDANAEGLYIGNGTKNLQIPLLNDNGKVPDDQLPEISAAKYTHITLTTGAWVEGSDGRFYQTVAVTDVAADTKVVMVDVDLSTNDADAKVAYLEAWAHPAANEVTQGNGTLTFYAWEQPVSNIPINVGVM